MKPRKLVACLAVGGVIAWGGLAALSFVVGKLLHPTAQVGIAGDLFGGASAMFAGFGALGVVYVLNRDGKDRREDLKNRNDDLEEIRRHRLQELRPFVSARVSAGKVSVAQWSNDVFNLELNFPLAILNASNTPALNLSSRVEIEVNGRVFKGLMPLGEEPLFPADAGADSRRERTLTFSLYGPDASQAAEHLRDGGRGRIDFRVEYTSLSGVTWCTSVAYEVQCKDKAAKDDLEVSLNPDSEGIGRGIAGGASVALSAQTVPGSWSQVSTV